MFAHACFNNEGKIFPLLREKLEISPQAKKIRD